MGLFDDFTSSSDRRSSLLSTMASVSRLPSVRRTAASSASSSSPKTRPMSMIEPSTSNLPVMNQLPTTPKQSKRRSLLPQFSTSRKGSADYSPDEGFNAIQEYEEPVRASSRTSPTSDDAAADRRAMPPPTTKLGRPMSSYGGTGIKPPASRTVPHGRETSSRPPAGREEALRMLNGSSGGAARAHARASSNTTVQRSGSTRVPASPSASRGTARPTSMKPPMGHSRGNSTDKRASAAIGRPPSTSISSVGSKATSREGSPPSPNRPTTSRTRMPAPSRPAFNTYQQHYSPAKSVLPKPPLPGTRNVRSPSVVGSDEESAISAETCWKEQIELLQLSLLHQASLTTAREFEDDAHHKLASRHGKLQREYESVSTMEREQQRLANLTALNAWSPDSELLVENMQILGRIHSELDSLTQSDGRYDELVCVFEAWMEDAECIFSGARNGFVENLPDVWRTTHTSLALKLRALQRDMETLPRVPRGEAEKSSIGVLVRSCWDMLEGMLRELEVMSKLEKAVLEKETSRVDEDVMITAEGVGGGGEKGWVPAWQSVVSVV